MTPRFSTSGSVIPRLSPYPSHDSPGTEAVAFATHEPTTTPAQIRKTV